MGTGRDTLRQAVVLTAFVGMVVMNAVANQLPLGGRTTGEVSGRYPVLFTPAGYAFSIWGLIYAFLALFVVYQALPRQSSDLRLRQVGWPFVLSCAFNVAWLFAWHHLQIGLSLLAMAALAASLVVIYRRLAAVPAANAAARWAVEVPFSLYFGWITVASLANLAIAASAAGWTAWETEPLWSVLAIAFATGIGSLVIGRRRDKVYGLVLVWALIAIAVRQWGTPAVALPALVAAGLLVMRLVLLLRVRTRHRRPTPAGAGPRG